MKRAAVLGAAWTASAAAAIGLGFLAVSLVGASAAPAAPRTVVTGTPTSSPPVAAPNPSGQQATAGGTVYATCVSGAADLASAPAAGWRVDESATAGTVEFRDATRKVEIHVVCVSGTPSFTVEGPRADSSGRGSAATSSAAPTSGGGGGGSGSGSSGGDDSSGRGGGGHGSDG